MNAVVTGSTKGIGRAILFALLREGWNVSASSRNESDLQALQQTAAGLYPNNECHIYSLDFSDKTAVREYGKHLTEHWQSIDLLVNNVGIFKPGSVHAEEEGMLEKMIDTNLYSAYHLTRTLLPGMMEQKGGCIINMCSIASFMSYPNGGSYTISKFALLGLTKVLREEMKPYDIKVSAIMPGATWSASWADANFPVERLMPAEDVAEAVILITKMSPASVVEEMIIRPQLGDLS